MIVPILLAAMALILAYIGSRKQLSKMQFVFVAMFFLVGAFGVVFQDSSMKLAALLHVGRGADLLLYFSVLCGVLVATNFYFRFKETERALIEIVRRVAILSPRFPAQQNSGK